MKRAKYIHNLDTLEREIYRLKLEARNLEEKLDHSLDYLQDNYFQMTMNSIFHNKKQNGEERNGFFESILKSESFNAAINRFAGHIADKAAAGVERLADKILAKTGKD